MSGTVGEVVATDLTAATMGADMRLTRPRSSRRPRPRTRVGDLGAALPAAPAGGLRFSPRVTPQRTGRPPTNRLATASCTADGRR
ncbi:MAG: hypothetical protein IPL60_17780 [Ardenticatenia bacterium]|nr:hypothetical protein [Ardenticatenia bacterium]